MIPTKMLFSPTEDSFSENLLFCSREKIFYLAFAINSGGIPDVLYGNDL